MNALFQHLTVPDLWQQEALQALRAGKDVVVHAPTGAGKTYIFEMYQPQLKGQAVFTVPTRALANDKLTEWRERGWDVGISTGDIERALIEWRSVLRHIALAPGCDWERWRELQRAAARHIESNAPVRLPDLPALTAAQRRKE